MTIEFCCSKCETVFEKLPEDIVCPKCKSKLDDKWRKVTHIRNYDVISVSMPISNSGKFFFTAVFKDNELISEKGFRSKKEALDYHKKEVLKYE